MLRMLPYLIVVAGVVAMIVWLVPRLRSTQNQLPSEPELVPPSASAVLAYGPDQGPGQLRLSGSQLVFTAQSGRVIVIERLDIQGVTTTCDLPDRTTAAEVLAIATDPEVYYFQVAQPRWWVGLLT